MEQTYSIHVSTQGAHTAKARILSYTEGVLGFGEGENILVAIEDAAKNAAKEGHFGTLALAEALRKDGW